MEDAGIEPDAADAAETPDADGASRDVADDAARAWPISEGCNPLAYRHDCFFPFPSDFFRRADPSNPERFVVRLTPPAMIGAPHGAVDPLRTRPADGAPSHPQLFVYRDEGFAADQFPGPDEVASHTPSPAGRTILLDVDRGELVPHFAETFAGWEETRGKLLAMRPLVRLRDGARYVAAVQDVVDEQGAPLDAPAGFREFRDGDLDGAPGWVRDEAERFESEVFPLLEAAGVARDDLVLAWDFTVESAASARGDLELIRDDAIARMELVEPRVRIDRVIEGDDLPEALRHHVYRRIDGALLAVPSYLEGVEGAALRRDSAGRPTLAGNAVVPFTALIPRSVAENVEDGPVRIVQFGHGLFGGRTEIVDNWQYVVANRLQYVIIAVDWWGFSSQDLPRLVGAITGNLGEVFQFAERTAQAMVNQLALERAIAGPLARERAFMVEGRPTYTPDRHYFLGVSGGGIFGGTFAALATRIDRFVLGVGGASFGLIMSRSDAFGALNVLLRQSLGELHAHRVTAVAPFALHVIDPINWAPAVAKSDAHVLSQVGLGDTAVPPIAAELAARAYGQSLLTPSPRTPPLLPAGPGPLDSALVMVDFGVDPAVGRQWRSIDVDTPAHEGVRRFDPMIEMMDRFFMPDGRVEQTCDGPCAAR